MSGIITFIQQHPTVFSLIAFYVSSAFIGSLPAPEVNSSQFYRFMFQFLNTLGANLTRAFSSKLPVPAAQAVGLADAQEAKGLVADPPRAAPPVLPISGK
jgi:hypothetical protein